MGTEYSSTVAIPPYPLGKGLFFLGLGVLLIFGGYMKSKQRSSEETVAKWKETIDKWETLNHALTSAVEKDVQNSDSETLTKMIGQLNTLSDSLEDLRRSTANDSFCHAIEEKQLGYSCKRVNELIDSTQEKVAEAFKIIFRAGGTEEIETQTNSEENLSSNSREEEKQ